MSSEDIPRASGDHNQLLEEASLWFSRMRGPAAEQYRQEFEKWIGGGALHRAAYADVNDAWSATNGMRRQAPPTDNSISAPAPPSRARPIGALIAASLLPIGVAAGIGVSRLLWLHSPADGARIMPQAGELMASTADATFSLADGTTLMLAAGSRLTFHYEAKARKLTLLRGAARFDVMHEGRPFIVYAGGGTVIDHGTTFDVGIRRGLVQVHLIKGAVEVRMPRPVGVGAPPATGLKPGQSLAYTIEAPSAEPATPSAPTPDLAMHVFNNATLAHVIDVANSTPGQPIRLDQSAIRELLVSGAFRMEDHRHLAKIIADKLHLKVGETGDVITLSQP